ncbi:MAG: hypothetical protein ACTHM1_10360 [Solirubrobacteraceae bacterium]
MRDRPIAERERHTAMVAVIVLLATAAVLLTLSHPSRQTGETKEPVAHKRLGTTSIGSPPDAPALTSEAQQAASRFLAGYLSYTYGQAHPSQLSDASQLLIRSLRAHPPHVPPAARARHPKVIALQPAPALAGQLGVRAVVNDGGLIDYALKLTLALNDGRLVVTGLDGAK